MFMTVRCDRRIAVRCRGDAGIAVIPVTGWAICGKADDEGVNESGGTNFGIGKLAMDANSLRQRIAAIPVWYHHIGLCRGFATGSKPPRK